MRYVFRILFFLSLINSTAFANMNREEADYPYIRHADLKRLRQDPSWMILPSAAVQRALHVPAQGKEMPSLQTWSCAPNSAARAFCLLESDFCCRHLSPCDTSKQDQRKESYESFALKFPKSLGTPATTQGRSISLSSVCLGLGAAIGAQMLPENSRLKKLAIVSATIATIAGTVPYILGLSDQLFAAGNAGPAPSWLTDHLNSLYSSTGITAKLLRTSQFSEVLSQIEQAIKNSTPVIPLIVFNALAWHFITVIGFNSETNEVLILDTNSHIAILTEKQLTVLMDVGFLPQDSWPTYLVAKLVDTTSTLGRYNLIEFHKPRRDLKQNEDSND